MSDRRSSADSLRDWRSEVDELERREGLARLTGGEERVPRRHAAARRTVRGWIARRFDSGSLPTGGGVQAAYRRQIEAGADPDRSRAELEAHFESLRWPVRTAEAFGVEIIDLREARRLSCEWVELAHRIVPTQLGPTRRP